MLQTEYTTINSSPIFTSTLTVQAYARTTVTIVVGSVSAGSALNPGGSFTGTVRLQRSLNGGANFNDVSTWAVATEDIADQPEAISALYRFGADTGDFTTGEAVIKFASQ